MNYIALSNVDTIKKGELITEEDFNKLPANYKICFKAVGKQAEPEQKKVIPADLKFPNTKWKKDATKKWMSEQGIEFSEDDTETELLNKINDWKLANV